jgi:hypothetical protein
VSTTVLLEVTPQSDVDPDRFVSPPAEVLAILRAAGQTTACGLSYTKPGPWRFRFQLSGPDRVATGKALEGTFRRLGYDADVSIWP